MQTRFSILGFWETFLGVGARKHTLLGVAAREGSVLLGVGARKGGSSHYLSALQPVLGV